MTDATPRSALDPQHDPDAAPRVGSAPSLWPLVLGILGALALGTIVFLQLSSNRAQLEQARIAASKPAPVIAPPQPAPAPVPLIQPVIEPAPAAAPPVAETPPPPPPTGPSQAEIDRLRAPALVVDLGEYRAPTAVTPAGSPLDAKALSAGIGAQANPLNSDERFAQRLGVGDATKPSRATSRIDLANTVVEGAIIPAVLETALNSDLPGYVRAVVSRDVRSFDGAQVLIPHGSRLIGQYKSGVALGQSRAFVIWTRLIRPDGATIDMSSPATDALGRGGVDGDVNRHFLQRFGGAMLLTLLNLGVNAATEASDTAIVIASTRAGGDAASAAVNQGQNISPTVTVPPGAPVRVFVSQDLDFSAVGPANAPKRSPVPPSAAPPAAQSVVPSAATSGVQTPPPPAAVKAP